jgi:hypothetical protein
MITSHIPFDLGASISTVNYARWLAHDSWERGSQAKWRNYRKGVLVKTMFNINGKFNFFLWYEWVGSKETRKHRSEPWNSTKMKK